MPYPGTCRNGPLDGETMTLRRQDFLAVLRPAALYWVYRWNDEENAANAPGETDYFDLDLSLTEQEIADGLNADGTWDGSRPFTLQVQREAWAAGLDVVALDPARFPAEGASSGGDGGV